MRRFEYRVTGKVQGVYFRKYTQEKAKRCVGYMLHTDAFLWVCLHIHHVCGSLFFHLVIASSLLDSYVMMTVESVFGEAQGTPESLKEFAKWLAEVGSPKSRIDKCEIVNEKEIKERLYKEFEFRK